MTLFNDQNLAIAVVLSLMHFCWQALLIASVVGTLASLLNDPRWRYGTLLTGMVGITICPILNYALLCRHPTDTPTDSRAAIVQPESSSVTSNALQQREADNLPVVETEASKGSFVVSFGGGAVGWRYYAPLLVDVYLAGVMGMMAQVLIGLWGGRKLRRQSTPVLDITLQGILLRQVERIGLRFVPVMAYCDGVDVPAVVGLLRPAILLPFAMAAGLSLDQIEAVIAHELAHLRRCDHLINLLQRVVESILFFHPAVWWLSNRIRLEREHCCDDLAIGCGQCPLDYAGSLLRVAEMSCAARLEGATSAVSLLVTGRPSTLRLRVARLLDGRTETVVRLQHPWAVAATVAVCLYLALGPREITSVVSVRSGEVAAEEQVEKRESPLIDNVSPKVSQASLVRQQPVVVDIPQEEPVKVGVKAFAKKRDPLDDKIDRTLSVMSSRKLTIGGSKNLHSPWQVMHWIQGFGSHCLLKTGNSGLPTITGEEWIASGPEWLGEPVWQVTDAGACAHPYSLRLVFQGHPGQFLAWIGAGGVSIDFPIKAKDHSGKYQVVTVRDVLNDTKLRINRREEMSWTLWALAIYESLDAEWTSETKEVWSIERLASYEESQPIKHAPERGCTRLFALSMSLNKYRQTVGTTDGTLPGTWERIRDLLAREAERAKWSQLGNGTLHGEPLSNNLNARIHDRGTFLTWLAISLDEQSLDQPWIRQATEQLCDDYLQHQASVLDVSGVCHSANALRHLRERRERLITTGIEAQ